MLPIVMALLGAGLVLGAWANQPLSSTFGQVPASSAEHQLEWRMEATAHIASLVVRHMYCKVDASRQCDLPDNVQIGPLKEWAMKDYGWERILSSLWLYELARRFWQLQDFERSLVAVEQSIALKLFPYTDKHLLQQWQGSLVTHGYTFKRPKLELADALILKANCMYELGRREGTLEFLYQALECVHLSAAMMHCSMDVVPDVLRHLEVLSQHIAVTAADLLNKMKTSKVLDVMGRYGLRCDHCVERADYLEELVARLVLPVRLTSSGGRSASLEPLEDPFVQMAFVQHPEESVYEYQYRLLSQLVGVVHSSFLRDMRAPCTRVQGTMCVSFIPVWPLLAANNVFPAEEPATTSSCSSTDTGQCSSIAAAAQEQEQAAEHPLHAAMLGPRRVRRHLWGDLGPMIARFFANDISHELRHLVSTLDFLALLSATAMPPPPPGAPDYAERLQLCVNAPSENYHHCAVVLEQFDILSLPPFPAPGPTASKQLAPLAPLPFKPLPPLPGACCSSYRKRYEGPSGNWQLPTVKPSGGLAQPEAVAYDYLTDTLDPRQAFDIQLQEQLKRKAMEVQPLQGQDDPWVVVLLASSTLCSVLYAMLARNKRRAMRFVNDRLWTLARLLWRALGGRSAAAVAASGGGAETMTSAERSRTAAMLRDAMACSDLSRLEQLLASLGDICDDSDAGGLSTTVARARQQLMQRKKRERDRQQHAAAAGAAPGAARSAGAKQHNTQSRLSQQQAQTQAPVRPTLASLLPAGKAPHASAASTAACSTASTVSRSSSSSSGGPDVAADSDDSHTELESDSGPRRSWLGYLLSFRRTHLAPCAEDACSSSGHTAHTDLAADHEPGSPRALTPRSRAMRDANTRMEAAGNGSSGTAAGGSAPFAAAGGSQAGLAAGAVFTSDWVPEDAAKVLLTQLGLLKSDDEDDGWQQHTASKRHRPKLAAASGAASAPRASPTPTPVAAASKPAPAANPAPAPAAPAPLPKPASMKPVGAGSAKAALLLRGADATATVTATNVPATPPSPALAAAPPCAPATPAAAAPVPSRPADAPRSPSPGSWLKWLSNPASGTAAAADNAASSAPPRAGKARAGAAAAASAILAKKAVTGGTGKAASAHSKSTAAAAAAAAAVPPPKSAAPAAKPNCFKSAVAGPASSKQARAAAASAATANVPPKDRPPPATAGVGSQPASGPPSKASSHRGSDSVPASARHSTEHSRSGGGAAPMSAPPPPPPPYPSPRQLAMEREKLLSPATSATAAAAAAAAAAGSGPFSPACLSQGSSDSGHHPPSSLGPTPPSSARASQVVTAQPGSATFATAAAIGKPPFGSPAKHTQNLAAPPVQPLLPATAALFPPPAGPLDAYRSVAFAPPPGVVTASNSDGGTGCNGSYFSLGVGLPLLNTRSSAPLPAAGAANNSATAVPASLCDQLLDTSAVGGASMALPSLASLSSTASGSFFGYGSSQAPPAIASDSALLPTRQPLPPTAALPGLPSYGMFASSRVWAPQAAAAADPWSPASTSSSLPGQQQQLLQQAGTSGGLPPAAAAFLQGSVFASGGAVAGNSGPVYADPFAASPSWSAFGIMQSSSEDAFGNGQVHDLEASEIAQDIMRNVLF